MNMNKQTFAEIEICIGEKPTDLTKKDIENIVNIAQKYTGDNLHESIHKVIDNEYDPQTDMDDDSDLCLAVRVTQYIEYIDNAWDYNHVETLDSFHGECVYEIITLRYEQNQFEQLFGNSNDISTLLDKLNNTLPYHI